MVGKDNGCLEIANLYGAQTQLHSLHGSACYFLLLRAQKTLNYISTIAMKLLFHLRQVQSGTASQRTPGHRTSMILSSS
jgi:hypothetical protein